MVKKLLYTFFLLVGLSVFGQSKILTNLSASPNPFKNQTTISFVNEDASPVIFSVQNVLGKIVFQEKMYTRRGNNIFIFYKNNLNKGVYLYSIQKQSAVLTKRFVIQ